MGHGADMVLAIAEPMKVPICCQSIIYMKNKKAYSSLVVASSCCSDSSVALAYHSGQLNLASLRRQSAMVNCSTFSNNSGGVIQRELFVEDLFIPTFA